MDKDIKAGFDLGLGNECTPEADVTQTEADNTVGYGRPPRKSQFKKGLSGNPKGRPKHPVTGRECMNRIMGEMNSTTINGKNKKMATLEAFHRKLLAMALSGNAQLMGLIVKYYMQNVNITSILYPPEPITKETLEMQQKKEELYTIVHQILHDRHWNTGNS